MEDYTDGDWVVSIDDTGIPSGGRYVAQIKHTILNKTVTRYAYGVTYDEALENAKKLISEYK